MPGEETRQEETQDMELEDEQDQQEPGPYDIEEPEDLYPSADDVAEDEAKAEDEQKAEADTEGQDEQEDSDEDESSPLDPDLVEKAVSLGMSREDAESFPDDDFLGRTVLLLERQAKEKAEAEETEGEEADEEPEEQEEDVELDPDIYDEAIIKKFQNLEKKLNDVLEQHARLQEEREAQEAMQFADWFDDRIAELDDDYKSVLGTGRRHDLKPDSDEFKARARLIDQMNFEQEKRAKYGLEPLSEEDLFKRALEAEFPEIAKKTTKKGVMKAIRDSRGRFVARPTRRRSGSSTKPEDEAASFVKAWLEDHVDSIEEVPEDF